MSNEAPRQPEPEKIEPIEILKGQFLDLARKLTEGRPPLPTTRVAFYKLENEDLLIVTYRIHLSNPSYKKRASKEMQEVLNNMARQSGSAAKVLVYPCKYGQYANKIKYVLKLRGDFTSETGPLGGGESQIDKRMDELGERMFGQAPSPSVKISREIGIDPDAAMPQEMSEIIKKLEYIEPSKKEYEITEEEFDKLTGGQETVL